MNTTKTSISENEYTKIKCNDVGESHGLKRKDIKEYILYDST